MNNFRSLLLLLNALKKKIILTPATIIFIGLVLLFVLSGIVHPNTSRQLTEVTQTINSKIPTLRGEKAIEHLKAQGIFNSLEESIAAIRLAAPWQAWPRLDKSVWANRDKAGIHSDQSSADGSDCNWNEQAHLILKDGLEGDLFATSVAISGDTVVVGAQFREVGLNTDQGSAYVFIRNGANWMLQQQLIASDGAAFDSFGIAVAINGDTVVIGAYEDDIGINTNQGSAYVFVRSATSWSQQAKLIASDGELGDFFGRSVAISGDTVVVGAPEQNIGDNSRQGAIYLYNRNNGNWSQQAKLTASDGAAFDRLGWSVAISGDSVVAGAVFADVGSNADQGSAYVFVRSATSWSQQAKLIASDGIAQDGFGYSVAICDDTIAVGAPLGDIGANTNQGSAYVFVRSATSWSQQAKLTASDGAAVDEFGQSVSISGQTVIIGSPEDDLGANVNQGSAYVFIKVDLTWELQQKLIASDGTVVSDFGNSVSINNNTIIVGSVGDEVGANANQGSAYIFFTGCDTCPTIIVNPVTIPAGTIDMPYSQTFTQTGGLAPVTFNLSGKLPAGLFFNSVTATLSGTPSQAGSFPITVTVTDVNNCSSDRAYTLVVNFPLITWTGNISSDWHNPSNWDMNVVPMTIHDVLIPESGVVNQPVVSNNSASIHALTLEAGRVLTIESSRQLSTAADITSEGQIIGAGTISFNGATFTQNGCVGLASVEFGAGKHTLTGSGNFISGILAVAKDAKLTLASNHTIHMLAINSDGTFDATNQTLTLTGAGTPIFNSGTFIGTGSTIVYQGAVAQVVTANVAYHNLTINNASGASLAGDTTASGVLNLLTDLATGVFTLTMPASGSSSGTGDVIGNTRRTGFALSTPLSFGNPLNTLRFDSGTLPSEVNVNLVKTAPAGFPFNTVTRTYTITPTGGSGYSATLRLRYKDAELNGLNESTLELWRYNGSSWVSPAGSATRDTVNNFVEKTGITAFSPWAIAGSAGPTFIELISFAATVYDNGTLLEWQTGLETDNLGFNIYREEAGKRELVNQQLVAGSALRASSTLLTGESYAWFDARVNAAKQNTAYWLEDVDLAGKSTWHGPFYKKYIGGAVPAYSNAAVLSQIGRAQNESANTVTVERVTLPSSRSRATSEQLTLQASLANQTAIKIQVKRQGLYRLTQPQLIAAGLSAEVDPRRLQMFVDGEEIPIIVATGIDGRFDETAYLEFYGIGIDSPVTDLRVYWLTEGKQAGKRVQQFKGEGVVTASTSFTCAVERKERTTYFSALRNGEAENFFGAIITNQTVEQALLLTHLDAASSQPSGLEIKLQGVTQQAHRVSIELNGHHLGFINFDKQENRGEKFLLPRGLLSEGENLVRLSSQNGTGDVSLIDTIRIAYPHTFTADNDALQLTAKGGEQLTVGGFRNKALRVFDVTEVELPQELLGRVEQTKDGFYALTVAAPTAGDRSLIILADDQTRAPVALKANYPSDLKGAVGANFVIITKRSFFNALEPLRSKREGEGLRSLLVDVEDIYDEFNFGHKSPQAIKDFLLLAKTDWQVKPNFVLLAGDASYDAKNYLGFGDTDVVPTRLIDTTYLETASDDWYADFNNDAVAEMAVGRLPVRTAEEGIAIVTKLLRSNLTKASASALLVSDANDGFNFEQASAQIKTILAGQLTVEELQRGGLDEKTAKRYLFEALDSGKQFVNYIGHGSANSWRGNLLTAAEARALTNERLPVFVIMNCLNSYFQDAGTDSLAEALIKAEAGGSVAVWASSGITLPQDQAQLNQVFYRLMFSEKSNLRIGEATQKAKESVGDWDLRRTWILLGDPTMRIK